MSDIEYTLYYWPGIPGRGEYIRLVFEAAGVPYSFVDDISETTKLVGSTEHTPDPHFALPILKITYGPKMGGLPSPVRKTRKTEVGQDATKGERNQKEVFLSQSTNIMAYLGSKLGLVGDRDNDDEEMRAFRRAKCNQYVLTAMDLGIEAHDLHHPIASSLYYEDQKDEAIRRSGFFRRERVPKFFAHFDLAIRSNKEGNGRYLVGSSVTTADLILVQVFDGVRHSLPRLVSSLDKGEQYSALFSWRKMIDEDPKIGPYLKSGKRLPFTTGLYRHYPELDDEAE